MFYRKRIQALQEQINELATYKHTKYDFEGLHDLIARLKQNLEDVSNEVFKTEYGVTFPSSYKISKIEDLQKQITDLRKTHNAALSELKLENKKLKELLNEVIDYVYKGK